MDGHALQGWLLRGPVLRAEGFRVNRHPRCCMEPSCEEDASGMRRSWGWRVGWVVGGERCWGRKSSEQPSLMSGQHTQRGVQLKQATAAVPAEGPPAVNIQPNDSS